MHLQLLVFSVIYSFIQPVTSSTLPSPELHIKYGSQALNALERLLNFFEEDVNKLNLDGLYGLRIAQGQLDALHVALTSPSNEKHRFTDKNQYILSLSRQIERIANRSLTEIARQSSSYLQRFNLIAAKPFTVDYEARQVSPALIEEGSRTSEFNEEESDACFAQLLGSSNETNAKQCFVSQACWNLMTSSMTKDYRLTHQLLWFLVAKNIGCIDNRGVSNAANKNFKSLENRYCTNIYQDAQANFGVSFNQDLFLEELLLCSVIGYEQFLRFDWFNTILTWQHEKYGCFTEESEFIRKRHLLVEQEMANGCLSHKSGLASGLLAVYSRALLQ